MQSKTGIKLQCGGYDAGNWCAAGYWCEVGNWCDTGNWCVTSHYGSLKERLHMISIGLLLFEIITFYSLNATLIPIRKTGIKR